MAGRKEKYEHEVRDPIHGFIRYTGEERKVLDSKPLQRLRYINQLATAYMVYPGATHKRFEHSLGVMELATRVFDVLTNSHNLTDEIRTVLPELDDADKVRSWGRTLRLAALCHDLGHLPFSHAAEGELLPAGISHEMLTGKIIREALKAVWSLIDPPVDVERIVKLALGPKENAKADYTPWEAILSEIIVGDAFGVDRMDYLLRDSYHAGVPYGHFDHWRLIDNLRILTQAPSDSGATESAEAPALGMEVGALHTAEALLLARYYMFRQIYFHPIRLIYDIHLKDFLKEWLSDGHFPEKPEDHLRLTDNEVGAAIWKAAFEKSGPGHEHARRLVLHDHFRLIYSAARNDREKRTEAGEAVLEALGRQFDEKNFRRARHRMAAGSEDFPVLLKDGTVSSSIGQSDVLEKIPPISVDCVYADPLVCEKANAWLAANLDDVLVPKKEDPT